MWRDLLGITQEGACWGAHTVRLGPRLPHLCFRFGFSAHYEQKGAPPISELDEATQLAVMVIMGFHVPLAPLTRHTSLWSGVSPLQTHLLSPLLTSCCPHSLTLPYTPSVRSSLTSASRGITPSTIHMSAPCPVSTAIV